jgi:tRNA pseudouridine55 synthase
MIRCGSGTYVRSLGRDLAAAVGTGAVMSALIRSRIGSFDLGEAMSVEDLTLELIQAKILPPTMAVSHLPRLLLNSHQVNELRFGRAIPGNGETEYAGVDECGNLLAILKPKSSGLLKPHINFAPSA